MRDIFKNISENFSSKYEKNNFNRAKSYGGDQIKTALTTKNEKNKQTT